MTQHTLSLICRSRRLLVIFLSLHFLAFSGLAQSTPLFSQPPQSGGDLVDSFGNEEFADDFSVISDSKAIRVFWWARFLDSAAALSADNKFDIKFYEEDNVNIGEPGNVINSFIGITANRNTTSLLDFAGEPVFRFDYSFPTAVSLLTNETYFLSITHPNLVDPYFWLQSGSTGTEPYFNQNSAANRSWVELTGNNLSFILVPEPTIPMLFSIAVLVTAFQRRSRKNS